MTKFPSGEMSRSLPAASLRITNGTHGFLGAHGTVNSCAVGLPVDWCRARSATPPASPDESDAVFLVQQFRPVDERFRSRRGEGDKRMNDYQDLRPLPLLTRTPTPGPKEGASVGHHEG